MKNFRGTHGRRGTLAHGWSSIGGTALALSLCVSSGCDDGPGRPEHITPGIFAKAGEVMPRASDEQKQAFERGRELALHRFTPEEGLGPSFNLVSCAGCHERPTTGGSAGHYRDFLLVGTGLDDGSFVQTGKNGVQPQFTTDAQQRAPSDPATTVSATRNPIPFFGMGLLAEISDDEILRRADPDDKDGDGISGRANFDRGFVGRFGRKSQTVNVEGFIRGPLFNHLGITTTPLDDALRRNLPVASDSAQVRSAALDLLKRALVSRAHAQVAAPDEPNMDDDGVPDPELRAQDLFDLVSFAMLLAPLTPDASPSEAAQRGHGTFRELGCANCHSEDLAGPNGLVPAYTDLLLHSMGDAMADGIRMGDASEDEFRTQPLWGVAPTGPYLHDGRADTLDEAIRAHGGEAAASQAAYVNANEATRTDLIAFLESLGGRELRSGGLIPPDEPAAGVGEPGGPKSPLSEAELARFLRGRDVFDLDFGIHAGLGPSFNGDSCRGCHFDPVPGGAGPGDVDVTRQAVFAGGDSIAPPGGTMAHRHSNDGTRPAVNETANLFERRQTPSLLGLGLLEEVSDETLLQLAAEERPEGVSGRAHMLPDGRVGRLGWKANVPDLLDFVHDAMTNEMGITLPSGMSSFGASEDDDDAMDPELSMEALSDLTFFLRQLAPPARDESVADEATLNSGETLFSDVSCGACHRPSLPTRNGGEVAAYTDLLLHEVGGSHYVGVPDGDALPSELRTPPLWGLAQTAPYLHDGSASTMEQAIAAHASEAEASRVAYEQLDATGREALLAFLRSL